MYLTSKRSRFYTAAAFLSFFECALLSLALTSRLPEPFPAVSLCMAGGLAFALFAQNLAITFFRLSELIPPEGQAEAGRAAFLRLHELFLCHSITLSLVFWWVGCPWYIPCSWLKELLLWCFARPRRGKG